MKKIIVIPLVLLFFQIIAVSAQDTLKNFNNKWTTELNFNPFDGKLSLNNTEGQLKFRYLLPNNTAYRFALNVGYKQNNSNIKNVYGNNPYDNTSRQKSFLLGFSFGKEKHFSSSKRLSPYIGWELGVGFKTSSQKVNEDNGSTEIKGAWLSYKESSYVDQYGSTRYTSYRSYDERGYWSVGGNLAMGFDFYMARNFYFGYELMFGCDYLSYSNIDITDKNNITTGSNPNPNSNYPDYDEESWKLGPKLVNGVRIGFVF
jgi:hypothetical protein